MEAKTPLKYSLLTLVPVALWSSNFIVQKIALQSISVEWFNLIRFAFSIPFLIFVPKPGAKLTHLAIIALFWNVLNFNFLSTAIKLKSHMGLCAFLFQVCVIFGVLFNALLNHERVKLKNYLGIAISLSGVFLLMNPGIDDTGDFLYPSVLTICASISWGLGFAFIRKYKIDSSFSNIIWLIFLSFLWQVMINLLIKKPSFGELKNLQGETLLFIFYSFLVATVVAGQIWFFLCKKMSGASVGAYFLLVPLFTSALAMIFLGESFSNEIFLGGILILIGVRLNQEKKEEDKQGDKQQEPSNVLFRETSILRRDY